MAQTGNDILKQILGVCVQINKKLDKKGDTESSGGGALSGIFVKGKQKTAEKGTKIVDALFKSISGFVKMKPSGKKMESTAKGLKTLFQTVIWIGENQQKAQSAISLLDSLGEKLKNVEKTMNAMSRVMLAIGGAVILLVGGIVLAGKILGTRNFLATMGAVVLIIGVMAGSMILLGTIEKWVDKGSKVAKGMGMAMMFLTGGVVLFALGIAAVGNIIGAAGPQAMIVGILGILGIIGVMGLTFGILGQFSTNIVLGSLTAIVMSAGLAAIGWGVSKLAKAASQLSNMSDGKATNKAGEQRGKFGQMMSEIGPGLGMIGIVIVSSALLFAALSLISVPVIIGSIVTLLISFALTKIAKSVVSMADTAKALEGTDVKSMVKNMVGGVIGGLVDGYSQALGGGKGIKGMLKTAKNVGMLFTALTTLKDISRGLSLFAKAISAFAEVDNMRVIKGYKEDGEPIFGDKVNIKGVSENINASISTFLTSLLESTEGLTKRKAKAIKKMASALTGRMGILTGVIQFAEVMKVYSQFGDGTQIPWSYTVETGEKDENGNPITKTVSGTVPLTTIVNNIVSTFTHFVNDFTTKMQDFELSGKEGRKMKKLSKVLSGRNGLLSPISEFADVLQKYSQFGENNMIPIYDKDGNPTDKDPVSLTNVATNIFSAISKFVTLSDTHLGDITRKDIRESANKVKAFGGFVKQLNKLTSLDPKIDKTSASLLSLATSVGKLSDELNKLDTDTLASISKLGKARLPGLIAMTGVGVADAAANLVPKLQEAVQKREEIREERQERRQERREERKEEKKEKPGKTDAEIAREKLEEQQRLANMIGSSINAALQSRQFTFDFQGENKGILTLD